MSNATVSSQVYIFRNAGTISAVSTGTMIIYGDGTDLYAKDAANPPNIYNLTHPSASNLSIAINNLTDVNIQNLTSDSTNLIHVLRYDAGTSQWVNDNLEISIKQLTDVSNVDPTSGQVLQWNGSSWAPTTLSGSGTLIGLTDTPSSFGTAGQVLAVNSAENAAEWVSASNYTNSDVDAHLNQSGPTAGHVLSWNGSDYAWVSNGATGAHYTDADVDTHLNQSNPTSGYVLSWNGSDYAWVANSGSATSDGNQYQIQTADASNGFAAGDWSINTDFYPDAAGQNIGKPENHPVKKLFLKEGNSTAADAGGVYFAGNSSANQLNQYSSITTDGSHGKLYFTALQDNGTPAVHHYYFETEDDNSGELHIGGNGNHFTFKTDANLQDQIARLPQQKPTADGMSLVTDTAGGYAGNNFSLAWKRTSTAQSFSWSPAQKTIFSTGGMFPSVTSGFFRFTENLLGAGETWTSGGTAGQGLKFTTQIPISHHATKIALASDFEIKFSVSSPPMQTDITGATYDVWVKVVAKTKTSINTILDSSDVYTVTVTLPSAGSGFRLLTIPQATLEANLGTTTFSDCHYLDVQVNVFNGSASAQTNASLGGLGVSHFHLAFDIT